MWMEAERTERRLWKQTIQAYEVDTWAMVPQQGGTFTSPLQYADIEAMLAAHPGPKTFLIPAGRVEGSISLAKYAHPADAIYVFGNTEESMVAYVTDDDAVVTIETPWTSDMFPSSALAIVLHDRGLG